MAGRLKHMERSHRSHSNNYGTFAGFERKAMAVKQSKQQKKTLGQCFASYLKQMMPRTSSK